MTNDTYTFVLSSDLLRKLSAQVDIPNKSALNEFLADAINTYLHLGQLKQGGGDFFFLADGHEELIKLHFPFNR